MVAACLNSHAAPGCFVGALRPVAPASRIVPVHRRTAAKTRSRVNSAKSMRQVFVGANTNTGSPSRNSKKRPSVQMLALHAAPLWRLRVLAPCQGTRPNHNGLSLHELWSAQNLRISPCRPLTLDCGRRTENTMSFIIYSWQYPPRTQGLNNLGRGSISSTVRQYSVKDETPSAQAEQSSGIVAEDSPLVGRRRRPPDYRDPGVFTCALMSSGASAYFSSMTPAIFP